MHELNTLQQPVTSIQAKVEPDIIIRKPYKKAINLKPAPIPPDHHINIQESHIFTLPEIATKSTPTLKQRPSNEMKLSNLIDFGLVPDMPLTFRDIFKLKHDKSQRINLSDFISKSTQKQIISFHQPPETFDYSNQRFELNHPKRKIAPAFSFAGLSNLDTDSVRNSRSYQTLPPILPKDLERFSKFKTIESREENLKKIEKIVGDCENLLVKGKKSSRKLNIQISGIKYKGGNKGN